MARLRIDYGIDVGEDIFTITWPDIFLKDAAYALIRPLYEKASPWRKSYTDLSLYLHSQVRRLGSRRLLLFHFSNLAQIAVNYKSLYTFLLSPFDFTFDLSALFLELELFLSWRFSLEDPWTGYSKNTVFRNIRKPLDISVFHNPLIEKAVKECPSLLSNEDLVMQLFSSPVSSVTIEIVNADYCVFEVPIMLGSHYIEKQVLKELESSRKFYKVLGCFASWNDAQILLFKPTNDTSALFNTIRYKYNLTSIGDWQKAQVDDVDYYLALLIDFDIPQRSFLVSEWQINCPNLTIVS